MSGSQEQPWSDNPNAPNDPYPVYFQEKTYFAGMFVASMFYGTPKTPSPTCLSVREHFVRLVYSRGRDHTLLPMYRRAV